MMIAVSVCLGLGTGAMATPVVVASHEFHVDLTDTPWTEIADIPQYNPADFGGQALAQVDVHLKLDVVGDVTFNGKNTTVTAASAGGLARLNGPAGIDKSVRAEQQLAPPEIQLVEGQPVQLNVAASKEAWYWFDNAGVLAASTGEGTVPYEIGADGSLMLQIIGGNISVDQNTSVGAWLTVEYKVVPEPASMTLLVLGAIGLIGFVRKRSR